MISCVINLDSRNQNDVAETMFHGTVNWDYWIDGVLNKVKFLEGFEKEIIIYGDVHNEIPLEILSKLQSIADTVCLRKHTDENSFNDYNYLRALQMASGDIIVHFDQDVAAFTSSPEPINDMIKLLEVYDYISYPSYHSPNPVVDNNYDYFWCSTRFFMCKRETLDFTEIIKCLKDYDYLYQTYPASVKNHWTEHILALISKYKGKGVFYPAMNLDINAIFSFGSYKAGLLKELNNMNYPEIRQWLNSHPIIYPNDIHI